VDSLKRLRDFTLDSFEVMQNDPERLGELLKISWDLKRESSPAATNDVVDAIISEGLEAGATGAKLLGAGGGGFVLFYVPLPGRNRFVKTMSKSNPFNVSIDFQGSAIVYHK
jgi:D-glycero-alpha-D-manno-heptose-7-phosphate kinase